MGVGFTVSIMGQTGVGKTSLLNAIFGLNLLTSATKPATTALDPEFEIVREDGRLIIRDLPGLGESPTVDEDYLRLYRQWLLRSDVVIWAVHADSRSVSLDQMALRRLLEQAPDDERSRILSKLTIILTKVDLLTPPAWIYSRVGDGGLFAPDPVLAPVLQTKADYFTEHLILPFGEHIVPETYNDTGLTGSPVRGLIFDRDRIRHRGLMTREAADRFYRDRTVARNETLQRAIERLHDNYRVIPCSSLFRFNLARLMTVVVSKLGVGAVGMFNSLTQDNALNRLPFSTAKLLRNIVVVDQATQTVVFDLAQQD
ncbi:50S ribosome-binding GTPase [Catellatospora citrea]|nr:50S ribosome-binding GTPase [Catellatospora citrea]